MERGSRWRTALAWWGRVVPDVSAIGVVACAWGVHFGLVVPPPVPQPPAEPPLPPPAGPPPGHPERLAPDLPVSAAERELWERIGTW